MPLARFRTSSLAIVALCSIVSLAVSARQAERPDATKKIRANGVELHYVEQGSGVPVIFVPGGLEDYRAWQEQVEAFSPRYHAMAYSRRYNYPNTGAPAVSRYSASVDADDLAAFITGLQLPPVHVVGLSYGAYGALMLAVKHPNLVRSLVLSEPPVLGWLPGLEGGQPLYTEFMTKAWEPTTRAFGKGDEAGVKAAIDGFGELGYSGTAEKMTFAALPAEVRRVILDNAPEWRVLTASSDAFPALAVSDVKRIQAPTLLLSGQRSLKLAAVIDRELARVLPKAERTILPNATHEMWAEFPEECRTAVLAFLAKH